MTVVLTHGDADGICSAAIVKARYPDTRIVLSRPASLHRDLKEVINEDLVFVCDVAINESRKEELNSLSEKLGKRLKHLDHHPVQLKGHENPTHKSSSQLTHELLGEDLPEEMYLIAVLGAIADRLPTNFVNKAKKLWGPELVDLEYSILSLGLSASRGWFKKTVIEELSYGKFPTDIPALVRKALRTVDKEKDVKAFVHSKVQTQGEVAYVTNPPGRGSLGRAATLAMIYGEKPIGLCARLVNGRFDVSLRSEEINLSNVVSEAAHQVGGSGGGHPRASGGSIPEGKLKGFIRELNKLI